MMMSNVKKVKVNDLALTDRETIMLRNILLRNLDLKTLKRIWLKPTNAVRLSFHLDMVNESNEPIRLSKKYIKESFTKHINKPE